MALKSLRSSSAEPPLPPAVFSGQLFSRDGRTFDKKVANQFLEQYWQKSPCLIRKAFDFQSPLTADELAGLVSYASPTPSARNPPRESLAKLL